jgi:predicted MFS family arabinose efflux permease
MGRQDARSGLDEGSFPVSGLGHLARCVAKRFLAGCRAGIGAPGGWTGAWSAIAAMAGGGFALSASLALPVAAPAVAASSALAWGGAVMLPVLAAFGVGAALPRAIGHADRRAVLWLLSGLLIAADLGAALAPDTVSFLAARALSGVALGGFWSLALGLGGRLTARNSAARARALLAGASIAGGLPGALVLFLAGRVAAAWVPGADQLLSDRLAYAGSALLGISALAAQFAFLPHLPDNGVARRRLTDIRVQAAE